MTMIRFFVWENVLCRYGAPGMACAAGETFEKAVEALAHKLAQDRNFKAPGETAEQAYAGWIAYFNTEVAQEVMNGGAYYVEADAG